MSQENKKEEVSLKNDPRLRLFYLYRMLLENTDEENPMTTNQIVAQMQRQHEIKMHRTTVATDIDLLRSAGLDIIKYRGRSTRYYLAGREFSVAELKILIDAVQSSKLITAKQSANLIAKLASLASKGSAQKLKRNIHITGRAKSENKKAYYIVDAINEAINKELKISFQYFEYDARRKKKLRNEGEPYTISPYDLHWDGDFYYLIGYCDERESVRTFRVDRIFSAPEILNERIEPKPEDYEVDRFINEAFHMYVSEESETVTLLCENSQMKYLVDKFGMKFTVKKADSEHFRANVKVFCSPTFYAWVFGFKGAIVIEGPEAVRAEFRSMLQHQLENG